MNWFFFLNLFIIIGILFCGILIFYLEDTLQCIIASSVLGAFLTIEFLLLKAPDVAMAEAAVGAILTPIIFVVTLKKVNSSLKGKGEE